MFHSSLNPWHLGIHWQHFRRAFHEWKLRPTVIFLTLAPLGGSFMDIVRDVVASAGQGSKHEWAFDFRKHALPYPKPGDLCLGPQSWAHPARAYRRHHTRSAL